jgi:hypothetical protein
MRTTEAQALIYEARELRGRVLREMAVSAVEKIKRVYRKAVTSEQARARPAKPAAC